VLGILGPAASATLIADGTPPAVQVIFSPQALIDGSGRIFLSTASAVAFQIQDALSGVATSQFRVDAGIATPYQLYTSSFSLAVGTHTLDARFTDRVGNTRTVAGFTVNVSTMPPAGNTQPSAGTLPDGTPIVASPT